MLQSTTGPVRWTIVGARIIGIVGCLAVAAIHFIDQGGLPGSKDPEYVQVMYYLLEVVGVVAAGLLLARTTWWGWLLSLGVAAGPMVGYVLSRGPGLPNYLMTSATGPNHWGSSASSSRVSY